MVENALVIQQPSVPNTLKSQDTMTPAQLDLIKRTIAKGCSDDELQLFIYRCNHLGLDPMARQIYAIKTKDDLIMQISIQGLRIIAERTGKYKGQTSPMWCGKEGTWRDVWTEDQKPIAARVGVYREDFKEPIFGVAYMSEFSKSASRTWSSLPLHMLAKCAEAIALQKAFPSETTGLYTPEQIETPEAEMVKNNVSPLVTYSITSIIPEKLLPEVLRKKNLTFQDLATDETTFPLKDGSTANGMWLLEYWAENPSNECCKVAKEVLEANDSAIEILKK